MCHHIPPFASSNDLSTSFPPISASSLPIFCPPFFPSKKGLSALSAFTDYLAATARVLEEVMDPGKFAAKMQTYQSLKDPVLKDLVARTEKGDVEATLALQQEIVNRELGDSTCLE